jgi:hypothetical protein
MLLNCITKKCLNDPDPNTMAECKKHSDWNKLKEAIETELNLWKIGEGD